MNSADFIKNYDKIESQSLEVYPNFVVRAFTPVTFRNLNFTTDIKSPDELWKYIDTQHEGRFFENLGLLGGLTESEYELFQEAVDICINFTKILQRESIPINALSRSLISYRAIKSYYESLNRTPSVFEIGAGSGYLGLLCKLSGWEYSSIDVTKGLVTYQNALWNYAGCQVKFAQAGVTYSDSDFIQIPWWVWCNPKITLPRREIVVANHVIQEMTPLSLAFTIRRVKEMGSKYITAEGLGFGTYKTNLKTIQRNTVLMHNNSKKDAYQKIWVWKINGSVQKDNEFLSSPPLDPNGKRRFIARLINRMSPFLYIKINFWRANRLDNKKSGELLDEIFLQPKPAVSSQMVCDFLSLKKVPILTEDELFMRYADHKNHI